MDQVCVGANKCGTTFTLRKLLNITTIDLKEGEFFVLVWSLIDMDEEIYLRYFQIAAG